jgi:predicted alpha/beta superfamily hydrolase
VALVVVTAVLATPSPTVGAQTVAAASGYVLPGTDTWELSNAAGEAYRILVSMPEAPAPAEGYPVLYVLDGNALFAGFAEARLVQAWSAGPSSQRTSVGSSIIVAVGYPTDQPYDTARRRVDYTGPAPGAGSGQERFLDFLLNTLRPEVAKRYAINARRQALFGHSFGGLFALHVLYTRPEAFNAIIAASPSQWFNNQSILSEERLFTTRLSQAKNATAVSRVLVVVGEREERASMVWDAQALYARLQKLSAYGLRCRFQKLADEIHITVPSASITSTLRFAFGEP